MEDNERRGLLIIYTGDGKGKTTAALGQAVRARGWGMRVVMYQFIKSERLNTGEHRAASMLGLEISAVGCGLTCRSPDLERDRNAARSGWERCRITLADPHCDMVVMDELTYPIAYGWLDLKELIKAIRARPPHLHVVITGRNAPDELIAAADLVTVMQPVKHPHSIGMRPQKGVEY